MNTGVSAIIRSHPPISKKEMWVRLLVVLHELMYFPRIGNSVKTASHDEGKKAAAHSRQSRPRLCAGRAMQFACGFRQQYQTASGMTNQMLPVFVTGRLFLRESRIASD